MTSQLVLAAEAAAAVATEAAASGASTFVGDAHKGTFWLPEQGSSVAPGMDSVYYGTLGLSIFCFFAIAAVLVFFCVKYRHRPGERPQPSPAHHDVLELTWTIIPSIICVFLFLMGWRGYVDAATPPKHSIQVNTTAMAWNWQFEQSGVKDSVLHVPIDRPVKLIMTSVDYLHSFYAPAFRVKQDVVPGRYTYAWFQATKLGEFRLYCAEYCGLDHSQMKTKVVVHTQAEYDKYIYDKQQESMNMPPAELGALIFVKNGCKNCHTTDGKPAVGPTMKGLFGKDEPLVDGTSVKVDENYLRESIEDPVAKVVKGFAPAMPPFKGVLSDKEITGLIEYIKTLQ